MKIIHESELISPYRADIPEHIELTMEGYEIDRRMPHGAGDCRTCP